MKYIPAFSHIILLAAAAHEQENINGGSFVIDWSM